MGPDAFDAKRIVPRLLGLPFLELSGFGRGAPYHNLELKSEEGVSYSLVVSGETGNLPFLQGIVRHSAEDGRSDRVCHSF